jgi:hypothetical protein
VYRFDSQGDNPLKLTRPLMIDYTGVYFRRDGGSYIGGLSPKPEEEPETNNLDIDFDFFDNRVWPLLAHTHPSIPECEGLCRKQVSTDGNELILGEKRVGRLLRVQLFRREWCDRAPSRSLEFVLCHRF